jgi:S-formylglutathione hydrolase FrmB
VDTTDTVTRPPEATPPSRRGRARWLVPLLAAAAIVLLVLDWSSRYRKDRDAFDALFDSDATSPSGGTGSIDLPRGWDRGLGTGGYLERPWLVGLLWLLFLAAVAGAIWRWHRRRSTGRPLTRPVLRRTGTTLLVVVLFLLSGAATANAYVGYLPTIGSAFGDVGQDIRGGSRIDELSIGAPDLKVPASPTYVYVPPGYDAAGNSSHRYPVIYLLHGYPGTSADWIRAGDLQQVLDRLIRDRLVEPMIAVSPDANAGYIHDSEMVNQVGGPQLETYLTRTVPQKIDSAYRTVADRSGRAIGGMSAGGFGALNLALRNQAIFSVSVSMMPYGDPGSVLGSLFGGNRQLLEENTPSRYIPTTTFTPPMSVILIAGTEDPQLPTARQLYAQLKARGSDVDVALQVVPGGTHTWHGATMDSPYGLVFFSQRLKANAGTSGG